MSVDLGQSPEMASVPAIRPRALVWFRAYAALLSLIYVAAIGSALNMLKTEQAMAALGTPMTGMKGISIFLAVSCAVLLVAFAVALVLPRREWVWTYDLVLIGLGMTGAISVIPAVFLLVVWIKPETRAYFSDGGTPNKGFDRDSHGV